jgi:predicted Zn-dependent protease
MRLIGRQFRRFRYVAALGAFACALGALPGAVSRNSQLPEPARAPVATAKTDFLSAERRDELRVLDANGGVYQDAQLQSLVADVVERLAASSDRPDLRYQVVILNSPAVNAFSLPSGRLYVTRGLIALANDVSELAAVLAHEIGHVTARHASTREAPTGRPVDPFDSGARAFAGANFALPGFSRTQEVEADNIGAQISARAGYDPYGAVRFLGAMNRNAVLRSPGADETQSSHPATADRLSTAQTNARRYAVPGVADRDVAVLLANVDGLVYSDDPNDGVIRGRQFLHPRLGFTFTAPQGFSLTRSGEALLGTRAGGGEMLLLEPVSIPREQSLADYLAAGWMQNLDPTTVAERSIHGLAAATASAEGSQWSFRIAVLRLDWGAVRLIFASRPGARDLDRAFRELADTFLPMSAAEVAAAKPLRVRVVTVQPGETPAKLARRMAAVDRPLERFLVLNGLTPGQALKTGDRVKLITEDGHVRPPVK